MILGEFLSPIEEVAVVDAIKQAEKITTAEFRVHVESEDLEDHHKNAKKIFHELKMHIVDDKDGVLFYVGLEGLQFIILAGEWLNADVPSDFWDEINCEVEKAFKKGAFKIGLVTGILHTARKLKEYFPAKGNDLNELPDEISKH